MPFLYKKAEEQELLAGAILNDNNSAWAGQKRRGYGLGCLTTSWVKLSWGGTKRFVLQKQKQNKKRKKPPYRPKK